MSVEVDYDKLGYCAFCHKRIAEFVDDRFRKFCPDRREARFVLSSSSVMFVSLCENCHEGIGASDFERLMRSILKGWEHELEEIIDWSAEEKEDYMNRYAKQTITGRVS